MSCLCDSRNNEYNNLQAWCWEIEKIVFLSERRCYQRTTYDTKSFLTCTKIALQHQNIWCSHFKLMVLNLIWTVGKYIFGMSYWRLQPFHVQYLSFVEFVNVLTSHTFIYWRLRTFLHHIHTFIDGYGRFILKPFLSWWVGKFHVTYLYYWRVRTFHV